MTEEQIGSSFIAWAIEQGYAKEQAELVLNGDCDEDTPCVLSDAHEVWQAALAFAAKQYEAERIDFDKVGTVRDSQWGYWALVGDDGGIEEYRKDSYPHWKEGDRIRKILKAARSNENTGDTK